MNYPRVSEVIATKIIDTDWFTEADRERGTNVHNAILTYLRGLYVPRLKIGQGYVDSFKPWADTMVQEIRYADGYRFIDGVWLPYGPLISQTGFTGRPDFIGVLKGDTGLSIVDWKTSLSVQKAWRLQVNGGYRLLAEENGFKPITRTLSLRLDRDGGPAKVKEYENDPWDSVIFLDFLNVWRWFTTPEEGRGQ